MPFGLPVVPEENSTHSGWSKATGSTASDSRAVEIASAQLTASGTGWPNRDTTTVAVTVGRAARSASMSARRSWLRPP
ncbi:hypothetical protein CJ468_06032 [Nocardia farcinica]|nr:hypothetical protein CJ468_06032 [Nocardia farcinica]